MPCEGNSLTWLLGVTMSFEVGADKCKRVYDLIKTLNLQNKPCYPSKLSRSSGFSRGSIYNAINFLKKLDVIESERNGKHTELSIKKPSHLHA